MFTFFRQNIHVGFTFPSVVVFSVELPFDQVLQLIWNGEHKRACNFLQKSGVLSLSLLFRRVSDDLQCVRQSTRLQRGYRLLQTLTGEERSEKKKSADRAFNFEFRDLQKYTFFTAWQWGQIL